MAGVHSRHVKIPVVRILVTLEISGDQECFLWAERNLERPGYLEFSQ